MCYWDRWNMAFSDPDLMGIKRLPLGCPLRPHKSRCLFWTLAAGLSWEVFHMCLSGVGPHLCLSWAPPGISQELLPAMERQTKKFKR